MQREGLPAIVPFLPMHGNCDRMDDSIDRETFPYASNTAGKPVRHGAPQNIIPPGVPVCHRVIRREGLLAILMFCLSQYNLDRMDYPVECETFPYASNAQW